MNILILGGGGREHALAWAVKQNPKCDTLYAAPGNAGIAAHATCVALNPENSADVLSFVREKRHFIRDHWSRGALGHWGCR